MSERSTAGSHLSSVCVSSVMSAMTRWEEFTDAVVRELAKKEGLVYLLWGKPAQLK